jgi:hypothetical protein
VAGRSAGDSTKAFKKRVTNQFSETTVDKSAEISVETSRNPRRFAVAARFAPTPVRMNNSIPIRVLPQKRRISARAGSSHQERSFFFHMDKRF